MAEKHTDEKLYRVVRKDGSHLNTKVNPDGTKSALQFTDDNNDLNGPVDLLEVDEEELIRTEYISVPQAERSLGERLIDEVVVPVIRDATTQLLEYGTEKAEIWIEEKVVPVAKSKVKAGWENLKLFISAIKDFDKPIKATQIVTEQKNTFKASEIEVVNKVENQEEKKYALSPEEVELLRYSKAERINDPQWHRRSRTRRYSPERQCSFHWKETISFLVGLRVKCVSQL